MRRILPIALLAAFFVWPACRLHAAPAATVKSVLAGVPELEKPVTFSETKIPLDDLLQQVGSTTGVRLVATGPAADEPVAVVVTEMPAVRLLDELAALLDYRWTRDDANPKTAGRDRNSAARPGFRLHQDSDQKERERALREKARQNDLERLRQVVSSYGGVGKLTDAEFAAARQAMDRRTPQSPRLTSAEDRFQRGLRACDNIAKRGIAGLLGELTGNNWATLHSGKSLRFYSRPEAGERGMPPAVVQRLTSFRPSTTADLQRYLAAESGLPPGGTLEDRRARVARQDEAWAHPPSLQAVVRLERDLRLQAQVDAPALTIQAWPVGETGSSIAPPESLRIWIHPVTTQPGWGDDPPERKAALDHDPVFNREKPFQAAVRPVRTENGEAYLGQMPALLPEIARAYGVSVIADSYNAAPLLKGEDRNAKKAGQAPTSLRAVLSQLGGNYYRWDRHDDLVLLRSRSWFYDRPREIPLRLTRRWDQLLRQFGRLPMRDYFEAVWALSEDQFDCLNELQGRGVFPKGYFEFCLDPIERHAFRLLKLLNVTQRRRLERGEQLPFGELNAVQRELFAAVLDDEDHFRAGRISRADLAMASVRVETFRPEDMFRREDAGGVTYRQDQPGADPALLFGSAPPGFNSDQLPRTERFAVQCIAVILRCGTADTSTSGKRVAR
jgi:hypothetical protein